MSEQEALLILNAIPGIGNATIHKIIGFFGSAARFLSHSNEQLASLKALPVKVLEQVTQFARGEFLRNEYRLLQENGVTVVTLADQEYPQDLRNIADAPTVLYWKGKPFFGPSFGQEMKIAVVGSRRASVYGLTTAEQFSAQLAERGIMIISGMARGIDTASHRGCLRGKGNTVAVLGCGLAQCYPPENQDLMKEIALNGTLISEFPMTMPPLAMNFPRRNRIISGLAQGVLVVEAAQKSGALITAEFALDQGKDVFAIPGMVGQGSAQGTNRLIQQGAKLVLSIEDILDEYSDFMLPVAPVNRIKLAEGGGADLPPEEQQIYESIMERPVHLDMLANKTQFAVAELLPKLLQLEFKHLIRQLPGKFFVRLTK